MVLAKDGAPMKVPNKIPKNGGAPLKPPPPKDGKPNKI
jgi:hypothetical protein